METQQTVPPQSPLVQLENFFDTYLHKKAPFQLPANVKEWIVKYGPWIDLVLLVLALPLILAATGLILVFSPFGIYGSQFGSTSGIIHWVIMLVSFALEVAALPGLFKRSLKSWHLLYYSVLLSALGSLLNRDIFGLIIGTTISLYVLFQIREYYK